MPKRGENIHKRKDGRWEGRLIVSYTLDGKAKYLSVYGHSYAEVKEKLKQQERAKAIHQSNCTTYNMQKLCMEWLETVRIKVKQSTYAKYFDNVKKHILPSFQDVRTNHINIPLLNQFVKEEYEHGRLDGRGGLSSKTIHDIVSLLIQILQYGEAKGVVHSMNYHTLSLPKLSPKELKLLTVQEQSQLEHYIELCPNLEQLGVSLVLYTGLRIGELCALTWKDIDTEQGILKVTKTLQRIKDVDENSPFKTKIIIDTPKSKNSVREIPIPSFLLESLKKEKNAIQLMLSF